MRDKIFALVDGNNFFVSCERAFNPALQNVPVLVLSNNDGCVVARSNEVKALGIKMGVPYYKIESLVKEHNIQIFSSNFALYADMSNRVVKTLRSFVESVEVYSIDESFLRFENLPESADLVEFGRRIKSIIWKNTGIPVGIGIATTKTLAKVANKLAKKQKDLNGVLSFVNLNNVEIDEYLENSPVDDVWGIGYRSAIKLKSNGIVTALQFKNLDKKWIRKKMSVTGERTAMELEGISCIPFESIPQPKKTIASTRSFSYYVEELSQLEEAVTLYTTLACEKLRTQESVASMICVFIHTNKHKKNSKQYANAIWMHAMEPTNYTPDLVKLALSGLRKIFKKGYKYKKAGVIISQIIPQDSVQRDLFHTDLDIEEKEKKKNVINAVDKLNKRYGRGSVFIASQGIKMSWLAKSAKRTRRATTEWNEIPEASV